MFPRLTPSMEPPFFMQASMETKRSYQIVSLNFWLDYGKLLFSLKIIF